MSQAMIAVVDDEPLVRSATASLLRSLGHRVTVFDSAKEFLHASVCGFDCLISDVHMPGLSGLDLHRQLRATGCNLPLMLMTAQVTAEVSRYIAANDIVALLEKPIVTDNLIMAIAKALAEAPVGERPSCPGQRNVDF